MNFGGKHNSTCHRIHMGTRDEFGSDIPLVRSSDWPSLEFCSLTNSRVKGEPLGLDFWSIFLSCTSVIQGKRRQD